MSRNFELLSQLDADSAQAPRTKQSSSSVTAVDVDSAQPARPKQAAPNFAASEIISAHEIKEEASDEIVRFVQRTFLSTTEESPRRVVFCGIDGDNDSSSVCAQAGRALAEVSSRTVCLIDADRKLRRLSQSFGIDPFGSTAAKSSIFRSHCESIGNNLWIARHDLLFDDADSILPAEQIKRRLAELEQMFNFILIDAPGASVSGDTTILGQAAGAAILVIEASKTRKLTARRTIDNLTAGGVSVLGTVLNNRTFVIPEAIYRRF